MAKKDVILQTLAVADQVIEAKDGKKSLIGIFNQIFVKSVPATHSRMTLFATFVGESERSETVQITLESPSGKKIFDNTIKFKFGSNDKADVIINFEGMPLEEVGSYSLMVKLKEKVLGKYVIQVIQVKEQNAGDSIIN